MFAYFRFHRRGASASTTSSSTPNSPAQPIRPASSATIGSEFSANHSTVPSSPTTKSLASPRFTTSHGFHKRHKNDELGSDLVSSDVIQPPFVSNLPPVLPPIPRIAETVEDEEVGALHASDAVGGEHTPLPQLPGLSSMNINPLRLHAVLQTHAVGTSRPVLQTQGLTTSTKQNPMLQPKDDMSPVTFQREGLENEDKYSKPISLAYQLDFGQSFVLDDNSLLGQHDFQSKISTKSSSPTSFIPRETLYSSQQNEIEQESQLLHKPVSDRTASPTSSYSSFQKSISSTNLAAEASPLSQSPVSSRTFSNLPVAPALNTKSSKPRRSLLHPVSLLIRRRTANSIELGLTDLGLANKQLDTATSVPENYDPRIKGKGVHDFNAPRPRRNYSTNDLEGVMVSKGDASPVDEYKRRESVPWVPPHFETVDPISFQKERSHEKEHTPLFFENFEDENETNFDDSAVHRETLANQTFLARVVENADLDNPDLPVMQKSIIKLNQDANGQTQQDQIPLPAISITPDRSRDSSPAPNELGSMLTGQTVLENNSLPLPEPGNISQLLTPRVNQSSNASRTSRFSFQFADEQSAAQEHALEEKHKQKAAQKAITGQAHQNGLSSSDEDEDDSTEFDDDDTGLEEPVPGVNADQEEESDCYSSEHVHVHLDTLDLNGYPALNADLPESSATWPKSLKEVVEGLPIISTHGSMLSQADIQRPRSTSVSNRSDEMYFDDGMIEDSSIRESQEFDESVFDSPSKSIRNADSLQQKPINGRQLWQENSDAFHSMDAQSRLGRDQAALGILPGENSVSQPGFKELDSSVLNLEAYHSALASAASEAHAAGYFKRDIMEENISIKDEEFRDLHTHEGNSNDQDPTSSGDQGFFSWDEGSATPTDWPDYGDNENNRGFDDDDYEDDPMIAAANAEALAADDSGYYGREFNFYGNGKAGTELYNGGVFGDPAKDGLGRTTSLREPTLTPITERSEFSRAPSYMSLNTFGNMNASTMVPSVASPGLKELAARFGLDHDDMTLKQLMKLRKDTFNGGTAGSSGSSPSSFSSSPLLLKSPPVPTQQPSIPTATLAHKILEEGDENSDVSLENREHEISNYGHDSAHWERAEPIPTNLGFPQAAGPWPVKSSRPSHTPSYSSDSTSSTSVANPFTPLASKSTNDASSTPMPSAQLMQKFAARPPASSATYAERQAEKMQSSQQKNASGKAGDDATGLGIGSESIAYVREDDQWFIEKRRTLGNGEVVVSTRELVEGGRI